MDSEHLSKKIRGIKGNAGKRHKKPKGFKLLKKRKKRSVSQGIIEIKKDLSYLLQATENELNLFRAKVKPETFSEKVYCKKVEMALERLIECYALLIENIEKRDVDYLDSLFSSIKRARRKIDVLSVMNINYIEPSPQIRELKRYVLHIVDRGKPYKEHLQSSIKKAYEYIEDLSYHNEREYEKVKDKGEYVSVVFEALKKNLENFSSSLKKIEDGLKSEDKEKLIEGLIESKEAHMDLQNLLDGKFED